MNLKRALVNQREFIWKKGKGKIVLYYNLKTKKNKETKKPTSESPVQL